MKKIYFLICCAAVCLCTACGGKDNITVKGENGTEYESYQEACTAADFQAAHQYLNKMQSIDSPELKEATEYVFKQEALFLMSQGDEAAKKRLIYLLKEEGGNNEHVAMLIDLAIEEDDTTFIKQLANQYTEGASNESLTKVTNYLQSFPNSDCQKFVQNLLKTLKKEGLLLDYAINQNNKAYIDEYLSTYKLSLYSYNNNLLNYMATTKEKKYTEKIISLLVEEEGSITKKPQMGTTRFGGTGRSTSEFEDMCEQYQSTIRSFNGQCQKVLSIAINSGNSYLAQRAVSKFRSNINVEELGWINNYYTYNITADNEDIQQAQNTYQEAVRSGAFK